MREADGGNVVIDVSVETSSSRPGLHGYDPWRSRLQLRVGAPPRGGMANREVVELVAALLDVASGRVSIVSGATSRRKAVRVEGLALDTAISRLEEALTTGGGEGP